jgi:hypothetical protein
MQAMVITIPVSLAMGSPQPEPNEPLALGSSTSQPTASVLHVTPFPVPLDVAAQGNKQALQALHAWVSEYARQVDEALSSMGEQGSS